MVAVAKNDVDNFNFSLPADVAAEFRRIGDVHGERNKLRWAVATAAVLKLLELPEPEMHALIRQIAGARHYPETLREMIGAAKGKSGEKQKPKPDYKKNIGNVSQQQAQRAAGTPTPGKPSQK